MSRKHTQTIIIRDFRILLSITDRNLSKSLKIRFLKIQLSNEVIEVLVALTPEKMHFQVHVEHYTHEIMRLDKFLRNK